jgi:hypothetical protein
MSSRQRDGSLKRDILATIVFLITGALFWIAQTGTPASARYSCTEGWSQEQTLSVVEDHGVASVGEEPEIGTTRDS